jgi:D-serine deaminase-like pyridoxal phosphate-dependent protein
MYNSLTEPTLLLDKQKCLYNISMMAEKARKNNVTLRPHFKTHQSHEVGRWFREKGVTKITVSSLKMAEYFASDGWDDITVAFPVNVHEHDRINRLAEKINLNLLVVAPQTIPWLANEVNHRITIFIEVDTGYHRTGLSPNQTKTIDEILIRMQPYENLHFAGFLAHAGHSYAVRQHRENLLAIHRESVTILQSLKQQYEGDYPELILSYGDTPTCSVADSFIGLGEIRPGNLVFYDVTQEQIGSCSLDQIAVAMACPVVAVYPERNEVVVHGGAVHFSKDSLKLPDGIVHFGKVVTLTKAGWSTDETSMYVKSLSQEHGIIHTDHADRIKIGDWLGVLPVHSCLTADAMKAYLTIAGERILTI